MALLNKYPGYSSLRALCGIGWVSIIPCTIHVDAYKLTGSSRFDGATVGRNWKISKE